MRSFLDEQRKHINETEDLREERINASLERFTSDIFELSPKSSQNSSKNLNKDEILAEVIANYINMGAEILPVNPWARVRERKFNASINEAQKITFKIQTLKINLNYAMRLQKLLKPLLKLEFKAF